MAGATEAEIAVFTGHSLADVREILDKHYLSRDSALAENAVRKLEGRSANGIRKAGRQARATKREKRNRIKWLGD